MPDSRTFGSIGSVEGEHRAMWTASIVEMVERLAGVHDTG